MYIKLYKKGRGFNLHYQKFNYAMNSKYKEKIYWRCVNSNCLSRIPTNFDRDTILSGPFPEHNQIKNIEYNNMLEKRRKFLKEIDRNPLRKSAYGAVISILQRPFWKRWKISDYSFTTGMIHFWTDFWANFCTRLSASLLCSPKVLSTDAKHKRSIFEKRLSTTLFFPSVFRTHMVHHFPPECVECLCAPSYFTYNQRMRGI